MAAPATVHSFSEEVVAQEVLERALACQFWAPNHKLKGSWRFVQLGAESRRAAAALSVSAGPAAAASRAEAARSEALQRMPGCLVVVCKAFYVAEERLDKERQRALTAVHNVALGLTAQGVGVKWVTGATTENYELWELVSLEPNEEVIVGLLWFGRAATGGLRPVRDPTAASDKFSRVP